MVIIRRVIGADNFKLRYDAETDTYSNADGVSIEGIDFGGVKGVDYLDYLWGYPVPYTSIFASLIASLETVGYRAGYNLRGVPYDWRLPPDSHQNELFHKLKNLIEATQYMNGYRRVHVIAHGMGAPLFLYFLSTQTEEWKATYIASFIQIAAPWSGVPRILKTLLIGDNLGLEFLGPMTNHRLFTEVARSSGGLIAALPNPFFFPIDLPLIYLPTRNYTASHIESLFRDYDSIITGKIYKRVQWILPSLERPGVRTFCLYGTNRSTEIGYHYANAHVEKEPVHIDHTLEGDGMVPLSSIQECHRWAKTQEEKVTTEIFDLSKDDKGILENHDLIHFVLDTVTSKM